MCCRGGGWWGVQSTTRLKAMLAALRAKQGVASWAQLPSAQAMIEGLQEKERGTASAASTAVQLGLMAPVAR